MDFLPVFGEIGLYLSGLWITVQLVVMALVGGLVLGVPVALLAHSKAASVRVGPQAFIYFFRGTPLLVQIYLIYYGLGQFEAVRDSWLWPVLREPYWCAAIAFVLNTAAYTGEIIRGSIAQTAAGEVEAARACGMSRWVVYRRIVLPCAFRRALPTYSNEVIFMLHGSALAGVITITDLFGAARVVNSHHFVPFEAYITAGFFYLCLTFLIVWGFKRLERRWYAHLRPRAV